MSGKKNIILFSFLCPKAFKGCSFVYGGGHQKFPPFLLFKNQYKKKNDPFLFLCVSIYLFTILLPFDTRESIQMKGKSWRTDCPLVLAACHKHVKGGGRHHKFLRTFLFKIDQRGRGVYVKVIYGSDFVGGGVGPKIPLQSFF